VIEKGIGAKVIRVVDFFGNGGASATTGGVFGRSAHGYGYGYGYGWSSSAVEQ